jgi:structure-specific endonuclease subunit SLX1
MSEKKWYNYIIFDKLPSSKTYIGSTVNSTRRFRQHNGQIKGGAKYTRGGKWKPYVVLYDIDHTKSSALSYEWHLKNSSKKILKFGPKRIFGKRFSRYRRKCALENFIEPKIRSTNTYTHVLFVNSTYKYITPLLNSQVAIIYLNTNQFTTQTLDHWVEQIKLVNLIFKNLNISSNLQ